MRIKRINHAELAKLVRERKFKEADVLLNQCKLDHGECSLCGLAVCPKRDTMHFHHDGCPSCPSSEAEAIWNILEEHCGANDLATKEEFLNRVGGALKKKGKLEFRFCGALGYGGKLYINLRTDPLSVDCYVVDYTPQRKKMIDAANKALALLKGLEGP